MIPADSFTQDYAERIWSPLFRLFSRIWKWWQKTAGPPGLPARKMRSKENGTNPTQSSFLNGQIFNVEYVNLRI